MTSPVACANCGSPITEGQRFCMACGRPRASIEAQASVTAPPGLEGALSASVAASNAALDDLVANRIGIDEFRSRALIAGTVFTDDGIMMWDWSEMSWTFYDGLQVRKLGTE
jgi:hypothetical protein